MCSNIRRLPQDLFKPDAHRLKRNLCALINFAKFRDEKLGMLDELEAVMSKKVAREQALLADQENMVRALGRPRLTDY